MKTVVYQLYQPIRTSNVPAWIGRCMQTAKAWAASQGFDYRFDDDLFACVPSWYREKVAGSVILISDLARLVLAKELLSQGYDCTIWIDADVAIFDPQGFTINIVEGYAFIREVWVGLGDDGKLFHRERVTNAVSVFVQSNAFLDFYIHACHSIVRHKAELGNLDTSTRFLSALHDLMHLSLINNVGLFSPLVMADIVHGSGTVLRAYMEKFGTPVRAANLCSSFYGTRHDGILMDDGLYEAAIDKLVQTKGEVVNRHHRCSVSVGATAEAGDLNGAPAEGR